MSKYIVTSALPYANGKLHIGHVAGAYLPADIFVRYLRLKEEDVIYICGTDEHGAPISIKAEKEGVSPQVIVDRYHQSIKDSFAGLHIDFDNFSGTSRKPHYDLSQQFFTELLENGYITSKITQQFYDEQEARFLPDRYVEGTCPHCGADGARGDQCDTCGKLIDSITLVNPISKVSGSTPVIRDTKQWYLDLPKFTPQLKEWLETKTYWKENVRNFILSWLNEGLIERAITRDINWGVPVPLEEAEGKVLYVWFDAPIGYISSTIEWAQKLGKPELWKEYWLDQNTKLVHFIGKDNIPFHTIMWPSFVMGQNENYIFPHDVPANEYLNLEGDKISTSRNWAIWVDEFIKYFDGEYLRYVLAANAPEKQDNDFLWKDFQNKINTELNNVLGNLANRVFSFSKKHFDGFVEKPTQLNELSLSTLKQVKELTKEIDSCYKEYQVRKAVKTIMDIARLGNRYFDEREPWKVIKTDKEAVQETIYTSCEILRVISVVMTPILPNFMFELRKIMGLTTNAVWTELDASPYPIKLDNIVQIFHKVEDNQIEEQIKLLQENSKANQEAEKASFQDIKAEIEFDDFLKLDIRIAEILTATKVKKTDKLLQITADIGGKEIELIAGLAKAYTPEEIIGKKVVMLLNLKPRQIKGILSQGMILAADDGDTLSILTAHKDVKTGSVIG
ncbi:methionine--tRNA ligase [bacterium]|nr:methionine--tRNA ligase [bacterium]